MIFWLKLIDGKKMPKNIKIFEVGPRDGLQNTPFNVSIENRVKLIDTLSDTGIKKIECGSFVSEKWVPQMAGSGQLMRSIKRKSGVKYTALTPNITGFDRAIDANCDEVAIFASASETFSGKNINCSIVESIERFIPIIKKAKEIGVSVRGYVSCVIECPYEGSIDSGEVSKIVKKLMELGCYEVSLGDTIGKGTPKSVKSLLLDVCRDIDPSKLAGHFHDTNNNAIENVREAISHGLEVFDSAIGGLGGCPYAPGAKGNLSTRDLIEGIGPENFSSNLNLNKLDEAEKLIMSFD